jgi:DNA topoisomerase I
MDTIEKKRISVYNLKENLDRLKRKVNCDLLSGDEKEVLTALVIRIMLKTSERVGNSESANNGHFGVTQFQKKHLKVENNTIYLDYIGKSGVEHEKSFSDEKCATILKVLLKRNSKFLFTTIDGFQIKPDRINRYLGKFDVKSKDIRGFNANYYAIQKLNQIGKVKDEKERIKTFNQVVKQIAQKIGHGAATLKTHYLLPEIQETYYKNGTVKNIQI